MNLQRKKNLLKLIGKYKLQNEKNIKEESEEEIEEKENFPVQKYEQNVIAAQIDVNDVNWITSKITTMQSIKSQKFHSEKYQKIIMSMEVKKLLEN